MVTVGVVLTALWLALEPREVKQRGRLQQTSAVVVLGGRCFGEDW
jgi:hypothetical protein